MGEEVIIIAIEVLQGGLFQIDTEHSDSGKRDRIFIDGNDLFRMIGGAMQHNQRKWLRENGVGVSCVGGGKR